VHDESGIAELFEKVANPCGLMARRAVDTLRPVVGSYPTEDSFVSGTLRKHGFTGSIGKTPRDKKSTAVKHDHEKARQQGCMIEGNSLPGTEVAPLKGGA